MIRFKNIHQNRQALVWKGQVNLGWYKTVTPGQKFVVNRFIKLKIKFLDLYNQSLKQDLGLFTAFAMFWSHDLVLKMDILKAKVYSVIMQIAAVFTSHLDKWPKL